jgi:hypothetical protein
MYIYIYINISGISAWATAAAVPTVHHLKYPVYKYIDTGCSLDIGIRNCCGNGNACAPPVRTRIESLNRALKEPHWSLDRALKEP